MSAPAEILELVGRFLDNRVDYKGEGYNETRTRREFIDPLLRALGWDVDNSAGYGEAYKDVVHEDALRVEGSPKAPDYAIRVGGARKFFVEAKKPSVRLKSEPAPAYQLRRYAWSAKLPLSVLTDFEEFAAYDCRVKPGPTDSAATARILYVTCEEYAERWDEIAAIFSKDAVLRGAFDRFAVETKTRRGTAQVDTAFLAELEQWRESLAREIASKNRILTAAHLNYAVQATIDRIVFLRICEDRGLEPYGELSDLAKKNGVYDRLLQLFLSADQRYNSGLFHFGTEHGRGEPDTLTPDLQIGDATLSRIIRRLYYPESPYEFSVLSADILGQVYEQFLGRVISVSPTRKVVVEEKPEVNKAGGVYYTPAYVVEFVVDKALAPLIEEIQSDSFVRGTSRRRLRIVDPACGSGSFLIGAYQWLLDWYLAYYERSGAEGWAKGRQARVLQGPRGEWRLTSHERKRILTEHIFGVDIDPQAVEVTKLSLLLKVLEGVSSEAMQLELRLMQERALPDLDRNVRCGNSLVDSKVHSIIDPGVFTEEERVRLNVFDWDDEFPEIMGSGGFEVIVGNPPYVYRNATEVQLRSYYAQRYTVAQGNYELYKFFLERSLTLIRRGGRFGFIVSASFLVQPSFSKLREFLVSEAVISDLAPLGPGVFTKAAVDASIIVGARGLQSKNATISVRAPTTPTALPDTEPYSIPQRRFTTNDDFVFDYRLTQAGARLVRRLLDDFPPIERGFEFGVGINTGFIRGELVADRQLDNRYHPMVAGTGIERYGRVETTGWIMYDPDYVQSRGDQGRSLPQERFFTERKILVVRTRNLAIPRRIVATIDRDANYNLNRLSNIIARPGFDLLGLLGVLNSTLFQWLYLTRFFDYEIKPVYLRQSPLCDTQDTDLTTGVEALLRLHSELDDARFEAARAPIRREIALREAAVDRAVYRLYALTEHDVSLVTREAQRFGS